ncbi:MAG TPA: cytochrome b/b6 domain-containing protein [Acidobacteriota bacterium]|jgi:Ni,Fe-hydrogenase I cytochrome b subunit|nr:cytochrome b/b6 domain-containing protein [Acidobacteriota bacterium]
MNQTNVGSEYLGQAQIARLAAEREDVAIDDLIVRHTSKVRMTHWLVAIFFFLSLLTGFVMFTPYFAGLAGIFGGGPMVRLLHPWFSLGFVVAVFFLYNQWKERMKKELAMRNGGAGRRACH